MSRGVGVSLVGSVQREKRDAAAECGALSPGEPTSEVPRSDTGSWAQIPAEALRSVLGSSAAAGREGAAAGCCGAASGVPQAERKEPPSGV